MLKFGKDIHSIKGFTKMFFYFGRFKHLDGLLINSILFFGLSFSHLICYFDYFFVNTMALFQIKKNGSLVHLVWFKYVWDNRCF